MNSPRSAYALPSSAAVRKRASFWRKLKAAYFTNSSASVPDVRAISESCASCSGVKCTSIVELLPLYPKGNIEACQASAKTGRLISHQHRRPLTPTATACPFGPQKCGEVGPHRFFRRLINRMQLVPIYSTYFANAPIEWSNGHWRYCEAYRAVLYNSAV